MLPIRGAVCVERRRLFGKQPPHTSTHARALARAHTHTQTHMGAKLGSLYDWIIMKLQHAKRALSALEVNNM